MFTTMGLAANGFALGGLADWYATYLLRYNGASLESAGLVAGAATVLGGIVGNVLGCKVADYYDGKIRSSYLMVPALFCVPCCICIVWAVNTVDDAPAAYAAIFFAQIFAWTQIGPICAVTITCIPTHLRARSSGILIIVQHFLGDVISPPIIGGISDSTGSLQIGMQCTWVAMVVSGLWWASAAVFLPPVSYAVQDENGDKSETPITYRDILLTK
jgi:fucose permease